MSSIVAVIIALLGSNGLFALTQYLLTRKDGHKEALSRIEKRLDTQERDSCRTQLLLLISDYPDETAEIMKLAHHYFADLHGNWYMTSIFNQWLTKQGIGRPDWFKMV